MARFRRDWITCCPLFVLVPFCLCAQQNSRGKNVQPVERSPVPEMQAFTFVRVEWQGMAGNVPRSRFRSGPLWAHDYPTAERNLYTAINAVTSLPVTFEKKILSLDDEAIFDYPLLYICEVGYWSPSRREVKGLREYLPPEFPLPSWMMFCGEAKIKSSVLCAPCPILRHWFRKG